MSLSMLALRLATVEALRPHAALVAGGPWPTLAGREVTDTRIDPIEAVADYDRLMARIEGKPVVSVYTEEMTGEPFQPAAFPPEQAIVTLVIEMMIATRGVLVVQGVEADDVRTFGTVEAAVTDQQREATLDVLASQVAWVLATGPTGELFRRVRMEVRHLHSVPQRGDDKTLRIAARTLKLAVKVRNERWAPPAAGADGLDLLPEPLRAVARGLDPASAGGALCLALAALVPRPGTPGTPFTGVDVVAAFDGGTILAAF